MDLQEAGRAMGADSVVTGNFLLVGEQLQITLEAVDVEKNRLLWRDTVNVPSGNLLALQAQIAVQALRLRSSRRGRRAR